MSNENIINECDKCVYVKDTINGHVIMLQTKGLTRDQVNCSLKEMDLKPIFEKTS